MDSTPQDFHLEENRGRVLRRGIRSSGTGRPFAVAALRELPSPQKTRVCSGKGRTSAGTTGRTEQSGFLPRSRDISDAQSIVPNAELGHHPSQHLVPRQMRDEMRPRSGVLPQPNRAFLIPATGVACGSLPRPRHIRNPKRDPGGAAAGASPLTEEVGPSYVQRARWEAPCHAQARSLHRGGGGPPLHWGR